MEPTRGGGYARSVERAGQTAAAAHRVRTLEPHFIRGATTRALPAASRPLVRR